MRGSNCQFQSENGAHRALKWLLAMALSLTSLPAHATSDEPQLPRKNTWVGASIGVPLPVGGLLGVHLQRRLDARNFAEVGMSTIGLLSGVHVTWGYLFEPGTYLLAGADVDALISPFSGKLSLLPGVHSGLGWEWFPGPTRLSAELRFGFPWIGGFLFGASL